MLGKPFHRPSRAAILATSLLLPVLLTACGGNASPAAASGTSIQETYAAVSAAFTKAQADGAEPVLDTSSSLVGSHGLNANGIRPDIQAWIDAQPYSAKQKAAMVQDAQATQESILMDLSVPSNLQYENRIMMNAENCLGDSFLLNRPPTSDEAALYNKVSDSIEAFTMNTYQRASQYEKFNSAMNGTTTQLPNGNTCD